MTIPRAAYQLAGLRSILLCTLLGLVACSSHESKVGGMLNLNTDITLRVAAGADINPDHQNDPAPVFLRLYELSSDQAFKSADFIELYEREASALGDTLIQRRQLPGVAPNETREHQMVLDNNTRYIGILAEFFQYENAAYKIVVPITAKNVFRDSIRLRISGNQISVVN